MEVKVPQLPESVADATLVAWHRKVGEAVRRDENLVDLETDKVVLEVPAPANGLLKEIRIADGATVTSGEVLAVIEPGEAAAAEAPAGSSAPAAAAAIAPARSAASASARAQTPTRTVEAMERFGLRGGCGKRASWRRRTRIDRSRSPKHSSKRCAS